MDDIVKTALPRISAEEIHRRREALSQATANARIEGLYMSPESDALFERFIQGEIEIGDVLDILRERHGLK
ncbi:MAG: antitoxin VbhA family protein [Rhodospirillales bacterium]|nr:antitoxin VbhA family protein [Rhodospirillales bacterium]